MQAREEFSELSNLEAPVRGYLHRAPGARADSLILTHGAGTNCESPLLIALADAFCAGGLNVLRCDLPFRQLRPHGPPHRGAADRDQAGLRAAVAAMRRLVRGRVFLGGHSYGGRQASMVAASQPDLVEGLLLLSYPLHPPRQPLASRTQHFPSLFTPALFVHGTRDGFGAVAEMESALALIPARTELLTIVGAGHELMSRNDRQELLQQVISRFFGLAGASA